MSEIDWEKEIKIAKGTIEFKTEMISMDASEAIFGIMEEKGMTIDDLAKKMNMGKRFLNQLLMHGEQMRIKDLAKIAHCLDCKIKISLVDDQD